MPCGSQLGMDTGWGGLREAHLPPLSLHLLTFNSLSFFPFPSKPKSKQEGKELGRVQGLAGDRTRWLQIEGNLSFSHFTRKHFPAQQAESLHVYPNLFDRIIGLWNNSCHHFSLFTNQARKCYIREFGSKWLIV